MTIILAPCYELEESKREGLYPSVATPFRHRSKPPPSQASFSPLPLCFIFSVYRRVAAGPGDPNRRLWVSSASLERWRGRGEPNLSRRRRLAGKSRV
ncbi:hypothetical protein Bca101_024459 [Brassica carinata]